MHFAYIQQQYNFRCFCWCVHLVQRCCAYSHCHCVMCKDDANYGRPVAGSKTELRGKQAGIHISSEMIELCNIIRSMGVLQQDGSYAITFGNLFEFYTRISNKVLNTPYRYDFRPVSCFSWEMIQNSIIVSMEHE